MLLGYDQLGVAPLHCMGTVGQGHRQEGSYTLRL